VLTTERSSDGREARLEKQLVIALIIGLGAIVLAGFLIYSPRSTFDSQSALNWARDIWEGNLPNFGSYRAPTQHPLMLALGLLFQPAGDYGPQLMVLWSLIGYVALLIAAFRFGVLISGIFGGIVALGLLATRLDVAWLAGVGFLDPPYAALILWAAFLEARSPRRGGIVWVLLTMAGLLRPEAWLLTGMYMLWVGYPLEWSGRLRVLCYAAIGPLIWFSIDFAVTGNPLYSMTTTSRNAGDLGRSRPLATLPYYTLYWTNSVLKIPLSTIAGLGVVLAVQQRRRQLIIPAVLVATTWFSYLVIASGGLANVWRYILVAAIGLILFATYALTGWSLVDRGRRLRKWWAGGALLCVLVGVGWTATHLNVSKIDSDIKQRRQVSDNFRSIMVQPAVLRARKCGPVSVPSQKLLPEAKWAFRLEPPQIIPRSDTSFPVQKQGVAIVINPSYESRPDLNINEYAVDLSWVRLQIPPPGFKLIASNEFFLAYGRCAP
jgi:hypothetical protein